MRLPIRRGGRDRPYIGSIQQCGISLGVAVLLIVFGLARGAYVQSQIGLLCGLAIAAIGYNVALGLSGQFAFCQGAFMAIGCYTFAIVEPLIGVLAALVLGVMASGIVAAIVGVLVLRTREIYLAVVTLAFASALGVLIEHFPPTQGDNGIAVDLDGETAWLIGVVVLFLVMLFYQRLRSSHVGQMAVLVATDETSALTFGVRVHGVRVVMVALSGLLGGLGGVVWGGNLGFVTPDTFAVELTLLLLTIIVIAGSRSALLTVVVATLYVLSQQYLVSASKYAEVIYGALLLIAIYSRVYVAHYRRRGARSHAAQEERATHATMAPSGHIVSADIGVRS